MRITWLGHSGFRLEIGEQILLIDPWLAGNPAFPEERRPQAIEGATAILLTHGHGNHASNAASIAAKLGVPIACIHELSESPALSAAECIGFGKGGTIRFGDVRVTMVNAVHSSSVDFSDELGVAGSEAGFIIRGEDRCIYVSGDTDVMADMGWIGEYYEPDIGILCCGGHYTMDIDAAAWAAKRFFDFKTVIPCHYGTFPILAQSAEPLAAALPGIDVRLPNVLEPFEI
ncbi:metal-dependent hydrolase [Jannaschia aquimarina]|uniref:Metal-dependent hydrolase n=1 Tax=Jannaschia aquimarina TaxID=935700 RepID=A0A0D1DBM1_9RHOB|nr:metal-dependent hydrolase [Jannaschia aquimarina]KIT17368.1 metal-dependent hydrolase [Jannaschia aquimarina]SNS45473.1 L-ascorbate metabolism protein UlaG, beta-lactamase superfamily [Jannaschia aquimarina]